MKIYLLANTVTGVWKVDSLDDEACEILDQSDFLESLHNLRPGDLIGTTVDAECYSAIDKAYGIQ